MNLLSSLKKKTSIVFILFFLSSIQLAPFFLLQEDVTIPVTDTMDVYIPQYKVTATKEFSFCSFDRPVAQVMNGLNRDLLVSDLSVVYGLFFLLDAFWAYTINLLLIKIIAFWGMYLFLKNNFNTLNEKQIAIGSFLFSCIPFFPFFGIGIAGQPLLINSLVNFHKKKSTYIDILVLLCFPFYSSLIFTNIFLVASSFLFSVVYFLYEKKMPYRLLLATSVLFVLGALVEYRLLHAGLNKVFVPQRAEFDLSVFITQTGISGVLEGTSKILTTGIFHVSTLHALFVFILLILYWSKSNATSKKIILTTCAYITLIGLLYGLAHSNFYEIITSKIPFLKTFQVDRFYTLLPFLYFLLAFYCIQGILEKANPIKLKILNYTVILAMLVVFFNNSSLKAFLRSAINSNSDPTYAEYYDTHVLKEVQETISIPVKDYRMVGVGIDPQVLQYSGFYTLDAYLNIYPLAYKHKFRTVIAGELTKSEDIQKYFDHWGNRCYIFSSEIGKNLNKQSNEQYINELSINTSALKSLCDTEVYLLSTKIIKNAESIGLYLVKKFHSVNKFRSNLILYKVS